MDNKELYKCIYDTLTLEAEVYEEYGETIVKNMTAFNDLKSQDGYMTTCGKRNCPKEKDKLKELRELHQQTLLTFKFGSLTLRCAPTKDAILKLVNRFKGNASLKGTGYKPFCIKKAYTSLQCVGPYDWRKCGKGSPKQLEQLELDENKEV